MPDYISLEDYAHNEQQGFCIHPSGKWLYTIVHVHNSVGVFAIDQETGMLRLIQNAEIQGDWPRGGAISPNGKYFLTGCLVTGDIASYAIGEDGCLTASGARIQMKGCSYLSFYQPKSNTK